MFGKVVADFLLRGWASRPLFFACIGLSLCAGIWFPAFGTSDTSLVRREGIGVRLQLNPDYLSYAPQSDITLSYLARWRLGVQLQKQLSAHFHSKISLDYAAQSALLPFFDNDFTAHVSSSSAQVTAGLSYQSHALLVSVHPALFLHKAATKQRELHPGIQASAASTASTALAYARARLSYEYKPYWFVADAAQMQNSAGSRLLEIYGTHQTLQAKVFSGIGTVPVSLHIYRHMLDFSPQVHTEKSIPVAAKFIHMGSELIIGDSTTPSVSLQKFFGGGYLSARSLALDGPEILSIDSLQFSGIHAGFSSQRCYPVWISGAFTWMQASTPRLGVYSSPLSAWSIFLQKDYRFAGSVADMLAAGVGLGVQWAGHSQMEFTFHAASSYAFTRRFAKEILVFIPLYRYDRNFFSYAFAKWFRFEYTRTIRAAAFEGSWGISQALPLFKGSNPDVLDSESAGSQEPSSHKSVLRWAAVKAWLQWEFSPW